MQNYSRCREKIEGWRGRRRWYKCRQCDTPFRVDTLEPLPEAERICSVCRGKVKEHKIIDMDF
ncbi:hypothetical protein ES708_27392 [subsurface metagenome]